MLGRAWDIITTPFYRIKWWIKDLCRNTKFGFQRMFRGYDDSDSYDFLHSFIDKNYKLLNYFYKTHKSYPFELTEKQWDDVLQDMCKHLYMMEEDNVREYLKTGMPDGWEPANDSIYEIMIRHKNEFFDLMKEHFYDLWW
jgi:hypothetical protein